MNRFMHFIAMGGYGFYVWMAYGLAFVIFTGQILWVKLKKRKLKRTLRHLMTIKKT